VTWEGARNWSTTTDFGDTVNGDYFLHAGVEAWNAPDSIYSILSQTRAGNNDKALLNVRPGDSRDYLLQPIYDVTEIRQMDTVRTTDVNINGEYYAYAYFAAVLTEPGSSPFHESYNHPAVNVRILVERAGTLVDSFVVDYSTDEEGANGWKNVPGSTTIWFQQFKPKIKVQLGDVVTADASVRDCALGGHGAYAYFDQFGSVDPDTLVTDTTAAPCVYGSDLVSVGNYDTIVSNLASGGNLVVQASGRVFGGVQAAGSAQDAIFLGNYSVVDGNATTAGGIYSQSGSQITGTATSGANLTFPAIKTQTVIPGSTNVYANAGDVATLVPGNYGDLYANQGATIMLGAGTYYFGTFNTNGAKIIVDATSGVVNILANNLSVGDRTSILSVNPATDISTEINWYSGGSLYLGTDATLVGQIFAPTATVNIGSRTTLTGALRAKSIYFQPNLKFTCKAL
jgi:hypothetical protein